MVKKVFILNTRQFCGVAINLQGRWTSQPFISYSYLSQPRMQHKPRTNTHREDKETFIRVIDMKPSVAQSKTIPSNP